MGRVIVEGQLKSPPGLVTLPPPALYDGSEDRWENHDDLFEEFGIIRDLINHNYKNYKRALEAMQDHLRTAITKEREIKQKMTGKNIMQGGIRPEHLEMGRRPFVTDLTFWTTATNPMDPSTRGLILNWGQDGLANNANIYFAPYDDSSFVHIITADTYPTLGNSTRIFYIEPRLANFGTMQNTLAPATAARDGNIVLCMAQRTRDLSGTPVNVSYEYTIYGGGVHMLE